MVSVLTLSLWLPLGCDDPGSQSTPADSSGSPSDSVAGDSDTPRDTGTAALTCPAHQSCDQGFCDRTLIPAGTFPMGGEHAEHPESTWESGDERPVHQVSLGAFCIDTYEVTLERYEACVQAGACSPDGLQWDDEASGVDTVVNHYPRWCFNDMEKCLDRAVNAKNRSQAADYCGWIGARLCTEAEWERAANGPGPEQRLHPWGDEPPSSTLVNIPSVGTGYVEPVNLYGDGRSVEGVYNLAGNVYEWVADAYAPYEVPADGSPRVDPLVPVTSDADPVVGRGSCAFTEPEHTVSERTVFEQAFDWG